MASQANRDEERPAAWNGFLGRASNPCGLIDGCKMAVGHDLGGAIRGFASESAIDRHEEKPIVTTHQLKPALRHFDRHVHAPVAGYQVQDCRGPADQPAPPGQCAVVAGDGCREKVHNCCVADQLQWVAVDDDRVAPHPRKHRERPSPGDLRQADPPTVTAGQGSSGAAAVLPGLGLHVCKRHLCDRGHALERGWRRHRCAEYQNGFS